MRLAYVDDVLQELEHRKVVLEVIIAAQNCAILYDIYFKHEAISWGKLLFLVASLLLLFAVVFVNYMTTRAKSATGGAAPPAPDPQKLSARQVAIDRISELLTLGDYLVGQTPSNGATGSDYCRFWGEEMRRWSQEVSTLLTDNWGQEAMNNFYSTRGIQWDQPVPRIHTEAMANYLQLNRWLQNLERLKQTLPKT